VDRDDAGDWEVCKDDKRLVFDPEARRCNYSRSLGRRIGKKRCKPSRADLGVLQSDGVPVSSINEGVDLGVAMEPVMSVPVESGMHSELVNVVSV
jgi:hypothetical protein